MKSVLKIFVAEDCSSCIEARAIATRIKQDYPHLVVEVIDISDNDAVVPETIFATPTYMLNNRVVSLGNPKPDEIARWANGANNATHLA
jgi:hypothetical protein